MPEPTFEAEDFMAAYDLAVERRGWSTNPSSGKSWVHQPNEQIVQDALDILRACTCRDPLCPDHHWTTEKGSS